MSTSHKNFIKLLAFCLFSFAQLALAFDQAESDSVAQSTQSEKSTQQIPQKTSAQNQGTPQPVLSANSWLQPFSATYTLLHQGKERGSATRVLQKHPNNQWQLAMTTQAKIFLFKDKREEQSLFEFTNDELKPLDYQYQVKNSFTQKKTEEKYDWKNQQLKGHNTNLSWDVPIKMPLADPLNYQIIIRQKLISGQKTGTIKIPVSGKGEVKTRIFNILGEEQLSILNKKIDTIILSRKVGNRTTIFWMATQYQYIPVRIYQEQDREEQATLELQEIHYTINKPYKN